MTHNEKKKRLTIKTGPELTQLSELANEDIKTTIITIPDVQKVKQ